MGIKSPAYRFIAHRLLWQEIAIAPLVSLRVLFGFLMAISMVRFVAKGWVEDLYVKPNYFFTYYGFDWVQPFNENGMYLVFALLFLSALGILFGCFYRIASIAFFVLFTYVELIDKTNYLNHYYFVSIVSFLLIWVPANGRFSIDAWRNPALRIGQVPAWTIHLFKFQLGLVYVFAGIAKLNTDWLLKAMPLKLWLPGASDTPLIGSLLNYEWTAYVFSWSGAIYDLTIVFFLLYAPTRWLAYLAVIAFHVLTAVLFQIGMFPWIMMGMTLIYFSAEAHQKWHRQLQEFIGWTIPSSPLPTYQSIHKKGIVMALSIFFLIQLFLPFRYLLYPGSLYWTEQGYRFSWRVMLMEKAGYTTFTVTDKKDQRKEWVNNQDYLTRQQEKMMSMQPDMILQYAHFLKDTYQSKGFKEPIVHCSSRVTLNGVRSRPFVDPAVDLAKERRGFHHKTWILD